VNLSARLVFFITFCALSVPAVFGQSPLAPQLRCQINNLSLRNRSLDVVCSLNDLPAGKAAMQFADEFAGVDRLSERVHSLKIRDARGAAVPLEIRGNGSYWFSAATGSRPVSISYEMHLARALDPSQYALVSTIGPDAAVLMMADLLPRLCSGDENCAAAKNPVSLKVNPPGNWRVATTEQRQGEAFLIADPSRAIFLLGKFRERNTRIGQMNLRAAISGDWPFRDEESFTLAEAICREQAALVGGKERGDFLVVLVPFPQPLTGLRSSALTLGHTAVVLLNPNNDARQTTRHYRRHLAHEMFHFYLPNAFRVRENFDWFWEGFTRYVALMTLAKLRLIDLGEYLAAIGEEYEAYIFNPSRNQRSLVAASPEKFANAASYDLVYRKGMLVAALFDLELRWQSKGKSSLAGVMKALYQDYALTGRDVGNREVVAEMKKFGDFTNLIREDIEGVREINLAERVKGYGLIVPQNAQMRGKARLSAAPKLSARQRELLASLTADGL